MTKEARIYNGAKTVSSKTVRETGQIPLKNEKIILQVINI